MDLNSGSSIWVFLTLLLANIRLLLPFLLMAVVWYFIWKRKSSKEEPLNGDEALEQEHDENQSLNRLSVVLSWMLRITLVPSFIFAVLSIVPNVMMGYAGFLLIGLCWGLPISVIFVIRHSEGIRKSGKVRKAITIQAIALFFAFMPAIMLFWLFR